MKVLIYGNGWIGSQVIDLLKNSNHEVIIGSARANDMENVKSELQNIKPSHVMCFIGRTHGIIDGKTYSTIDYLEQPGKIYDNVRDNLFSPLLLVL